MRERMRCVCGEFFNTHTGRIATSGLRVCGATCVEKQDQAYYRAVTLNKPNPPTERERAILDRVVRLGGRISQSSGDNYAIGRLVNKGYMVIENQETLIATPYALKFYAENDVDGKRWDGRKWRETSVVGGDKS